jgi:hypothetical protein
MLRLNRSTISSSDMKKNTLGWRVCNKPVETKGESTKY